MRLYAVHFQFNNESPKIKVFTDRRKATVYRKERWIEAEDNETGCTANLYIMNVQPRSSSFINMLEYFVNMDYVEQSIEPKTIDSDAKTREHHSTCDK